MARRRRARAIGVTVCCASALLEPVAGGRRRELSLTFTTEAKDGSALPTNNSFVFDGTTSDIARQLYLRHSAGESVTQVIPNSIPTRVTDRLSPLNVTYEDLPGLLQRALLWDSGYAITPENDAVQIWTLGGRPMSNLAVSKLEFDTTSCTAKNCTQPDDTDYYTNEFCTGTQMLTAAKCLINDFDSDSSSHLAMWSNGGDPEMIPEIRAMTHGWRDSFTNQSYLVYAVHTMSVDAEPAYGTCSTGGYGSLVVPCYPMSNTSADVVAVMGEPVATPWLTTWIKQYQAPSETSVNSNASSGGSSFNLWLLVPIVLAALLAAGFVVIAVVRKRRRLRSAFRRQITANPIDTDEPSWKSKPLPGQLPRANRTSLRRTEQETIGEFNRTLRLPGDDEALSPVEDTSPVARDISPPTRIAATAPTRSASRESRSKSTSAARKTARRTGPPGRSNTLPARSTMPGVRDSLFGNRESLPQVGLPGVRESLSEDRGSSLDASNSVPEVHEALPAVRETFSRYSAVDNVQYTLVSDSNLIGKRIPWERIEFGRLLSRGAFGEVWGCRYAGKKVAVKRLLQSKKPTFLETQSFTDEIQLTASLSHPNIVRFVGVAWTSLENLAMVEEYLPRGDLQKYLKKNGDLMSWASDKIYMAIGVARGIEYLHSREVIHRDIKARNVLLTKRLQPKIIDFGTSRLWAPSDMSAGVGTPFWTAPEVLESTEYTEKADIYSFGVLLAELDTCEAPYHNLLGQDGTKMKPFHILKQVLDGLLTPSFTAGCPKRIRRVANACFQRDPRLRPSASDLIQQLQG
ncbi:hypothetical protein PHYBOEH_007079 [Phytophthora boehmeriae]|uniref:Protein kinase domain-containing protein n=1 Tax=Phytophthora boehmeriae TaxID=109152 RepID=A0A8T1WA76_9STRA|nr:hypothetical protein PHYBOEH_007079 [Phytophthora boehmeriae]